MSRAFQTFVKLKYRAPSQLSRSLVSQAFHCQEEWNARLVSPIFQKIKLGEFFVELDKKFSHEYRGSAVDVDIFAQAASSPADCEQLEELLYKLRRTPHTIFSPASTHHAAIRALLKAEEHPEGGEQVHHLVKMLEDRMNYGLFMDDYTTILLLDYMLENKRLLEGARIASQLMFQEESREGPGAVLGNLASWRYCKQARDVPWFFDTENPVDENPGEVIRVRVKGMVPNNYNDEHFDLKDGKIILGKTLVYLNNGDDNLNKSLRCLGYILSDKMDSAKSIEPFTISEEVLEIALEVAKSDDIKEFLSSLQTETNCVDDILLKRCQESLATSEAPIVDNQKKMYKEWSSNRDQMLEDEYKLLQRRGRLEAIQQTKEELAKEEEKLFFFENFDKLEIEKDEKDLAWRRTFPNRSFNSPGYFRKPRFVSKPGEERKISRVDRREIKRGPPK